MAAKTLRKDPWKELSSRKGTRHVDLREVLEELAVEQGEGFKKDLLRRVNRLMRTR
ncbi:MAG: hypothetical protein ACP5OO_01820 [Chloroflexia bacterium]